MPCHTFHYIPCIDICITLHRIIIHKIACHHIAPHTSSHYITVHYMKLHCNIASRYVALHHITFVYYIIIRGLSGVPHNEAIARSHVVFSTAFQQPHLLPRQCSFPRTRNRRLSESLATLEHDFWTSCCFVRLT